MKNKKKTKIIRSNNFPLPNPNSQTPLTKMSKFYRLLFKLLDLVFFSLHFRLQTCFNHLPFHFSTKLASLTGVTLCDLQKKDWFFLEIDK